MRSAAINIDQILSRLGMAVRRYVLLDGLGLLLLVACGIFWFTMGLDWVHFQARKLELPVWLRVMCMVGGGGLLAILLCSMTIRLLQGIRSRSLALVLERRFPQLNDRLITAVELNGDKSELDTSPLRRAMLERTSREAMEMARVLDLGSVFNSHPLRRKLTAAAVLLASVTVFGVLNAQAMERWVNAYLLARDDYWNPFRRNQLQVQVISQPGDRIREFDAQGIYKHPRGVSLEIQVLSGDKHPSPESVTLRTVSFTGSGVQRSRLEMNRVHENEFRHLVENVMHDMQIWVTGGDFTTRIPFRVHIVDPPRVDTVQLACDYPAYTGWDSLEDQLVMVAATQSALPLETRFTLLGKVNKSLSEVHVRTTRFDLSIPVQPSAGGQRLTIRDRESNTPRSIELSPSTEALITPDRKTFQVPLWITSAADKLLDELADGAQFPIPLPSGDAIQIYLEDDDGIYSPDPATFIINGIVDMPPVVDTKLRGVRNKVTRMATVPIDGRLTDDYGVAAAKFVWQVDKSETSSELPLHTSPDGQKEFRLQVNPADSLERFQLLPLTLKEGQALSLAIEAEDGDNLNGPHRGRGQPFTFTIVSTEELLAALYDDEINLRLRFEHIHSELTDLRTDLEAHLMQMQAETPAAAANPAPTLLAFVERGLHQLRKNHTESRAIQVSFQEIRDEMVNNHIETRELIDRIEQGVLQPMGILNETDFTAADVKWGECRMIAERGGEVRDSLQSAKVAVEAVLARMEAILAEMRDRSSDQQLIQLLQSLIEGQEQLMQETEEKGLEEKFFKLGQ